MSEFLPGVGPIRVEQEQIEIQQPIFDHVPAKPIPVQSPEQVRAMAAALAARDSESQNVAALMGLWTSGMLVKDMMEDHFHLRQEEEDEAAKRHPKLPLPENE